MIGRFKGNPNNQETYYASYYTVLHETWYIKEEIKRHNHIAAATPKVKITLLRVLYYVLLEKLPLVESLMSAYVPTNNHMLL